MIEGMPSRWRFVLVAIAIVMGSGCSDSSSSGSGPSACSEEWEETADARAQQMADCFDERGIDY